MSILICPICKKKLELNQKSYVCENGHTFDISKYGYTNLLSSSSSHIHGDNLEMIRARRDFLNSKGYEPLAKALQSIVKPYLGSHTTYLDAGCGEGYYSDIILENESTQAYGIDISKDALRVAYQRNVVRNGKLKTFVASAYEMPFEDNTFDIILNVFSPFAREEYYRLLKEKGHLVFVIPNEDHLFEMKSILYTHPYKNEVQDFACEGFRLVSSTPLSFPLHLTSQEQIQALFTMTPYYYRTPKDGREKLASLSTLSVSASFYVLLYEKT